ncbi:XRE family transcriptional regulator [Hwanghaeella grinnelliae]|uniref:XRE family transcriptional regulator n=1 Tax=Hwanghaeella grinnelliae TaxID=2500179 RepID=A0A3S3US87_9PROT|nr:helix-turn-helix transcriptional regulator [Hwanghaeella grinnelliae]RVU39358.1 XRE family transcriptional regulator [Hwanghaeella grinnelliae]
MITAAQIRAGRALLNVKQSELAKAAGVSLATLNNIERGVGDPRSSTLQAIERALKAAGVEVDEDGIHETVTLVKYARPNALDTYFGSQCVLECLSPKALMKVEQITAYVRHGGAGEPDDARARVCFLIGGSGRSLLFDQVEFTTATSPRLAEVAGILLAATIRLRDSLYFIDRVTEDTTALSLDEAIQLLHAYPARKLDTPRDFFSILGNWEEKFARYADKEGHPLRDLMGLYGPASAGIDG